MVVPMRPWQCTTIAWPVECPFFLFKGGEETRCRAHLERPTVSRRTPSLRHVIEPPVFEVIRLEVGRYDGRWTIVVECVVMSIFLS